MKFGVRRLLWVPLLQTLAFRHYFVKYEHQRRSCSSLLAVVDWEERARQLEDYAKENGNCLVPKRYAANPSLGNWVNKQRQQYRHYRLEEPSSLTPARIHTLESMGFCWKVGADTTESTSLRRERWLSCCKSLKAVAGDEGLWNMENYPSNLATWLRRQRCLYRKQKLQEWQVNALAEVDPKWWMTSHQIKWELRLRELQEFKGINGHTCVPITHENRKLAHWVSNQRKAYNLLNNGKKSDLTPERMAKLDAIGFVWDRWEFEFARKKN